LPSKSTLLKATATAAGVAALLLVTVVLPAEYGLDPLGAGAVLGLTQISASDPLPEETAAVANQAALTPVAEGPLDHYAGEYKSDVVEFDIGPYEYVEYKYRLAQGATMLYSWQASAELIHDMHGERDGAPANSAESFEKRNRQQASGSFTAPFSGLHGWYWENPGGDSVHVRLATAGFYSVGVEIRMDHSRHPRTLSSLNGSGRAAVVAAP
jgi:hypothetical protein